jgi:hypothetical protein
MKFEPQFPKDSVAYNTIKIDSILNARLVDFPKVNPAIKRGIPRENTVYTSSDS